MQEFMQWMLENSIKASVLAVLIYIGLTLFSRQISPKWKYFLWTLVAIRLIMPNLFPAQFSIFNLCNNISLEKQEMQKIHQSASASTGLTKFVPEISGIESHEKNRLEKIAAYIRNCSVWNIIFVIWSIGAGILGVLVLFKNFRLSAQVCTQRPLVKQPLLELLEDCKEQMDIHVPISIVSTRQVKSPALMGFIRPRLLLPENMMEAVSLENIRYIFLHELTHLRRKDIAVNWLLSIIQIMHWFNPFVWLSFAKIRIERETACDEAVLAFLEQKERINYGSTIIKLLEISPKQNPVACMAGILEDKQQIKRRIEMIRNFRIMPLRNSLLALALIAGFATFCFSEETKPTKVENKDATEKGIVNITADDIKINQETKEVTAKGKAVVSKDGNSINADEIIINGNKVTAKGKTKIIIANSISDKMKSITFDEIEFVDSSISSVVKYLDMRAKALDPEKKGVNIVLSLSPEQMKNPPTVTMVLNNVPLGNIIEYICKGTGLEYRIEEHAVVIYSPEKNNPNRTTGK